jgi:hypothetical protein
MLVATSGRRNWIVAAPNRAARNREGTAFSRAVKSRTDHPARLEAVPSRVLSQRFAVPSWVRPGDPAVPPGLARRLRRSSRVVGGISRLQLSPLRAENPEMCHPGPLQGEL